MERHCTNAQAVAEYLEAHPKVERVIYPGLASHPQHALARRQMDGFGGIVTAILAGGLAPSRRFLERVEVERHCTNAQAVAEYLEAHPKVERVIYPGLASHPQHALARRQMDGFGGIVTAILAGGLAPSRRFLERVEVFALAESLGGVESLIEHPAIMTHASIPALQRAALGIGDGLVRLSVGVEDVDDLIADLAQALR